MSDPRYDYTDELTYVQPHEARRRRRMRDDHDDYDDRDDPRLRDARRRDEERYRDRASRARTVRVATAIATILTSVFAVVLALQIVFTLLGANEDNALVQLVSGLAYTLSWFFHDLFTPDWVGLRILLNYGLAALFWLAVGQGISVLLRSLR